MAVVALMALMVSAGCKPSAPEAPAGTVASAAQTASMSARGTPEAPREIKIEVSDSMKFSVTQLTAAPGETLRVVLVNSGRAPKEAMGHNWVLLAAGVDATAYVNAAVGAKATDYLPAARAGDVLAHTKLLGGGARDAIVFTVPSAAGDYTYVCTFPAHLQLGMKGVLTVK